MLGRLVFVSIIVTITAAAQTQPQATLLGYATCRDRAKGWFAATREEEARLSVEQLDARASELETCYVNYEPHLDPFLAHDSSVPTSPDYFVTFYAKGDDLATMLFLEATYEAREVFLLRKEWLQSQTETLHAYEFIQRHHLMSEFRQKRVRTGLPNESKVSH